MNHREKMKALLSNPVVMAPFFIGGILGLFCSQVFLTSLIYMELTDQSNDDYDHAWSLYQLDTRVTALELNNTQGLYLHELEIYELEYDIYGNPVKGDQVIREQGVIRNPYR